ncbi:hypothetical protein LMG33818_001952 [Halomonadaceae bacterium LMG 33818]|uniref:sodium-dependent transporter n=1 Tax=Cernens ardua TaxID=3402176 RepID=UPI003EDC214C
MKDVIERWSSQRGFILAITGAAVGLGNIWRFPYVAGENGGALFFLLYVFFVICMGLPVMMAEIMIGRAGRRPPIQALTLLARERGYSSRWGGIGIFGLITVFLVLSFYSVVSGWSINYLREALMGDFSNQTPSTISHMLDHFLASPWQVVSYHTVFMCLTMAVVAMGVSTGLERLNNLLMPLLYMILIVLAAYSVTTPGFNIALHWLFTPKFSALSFSVILNAMGHAFFTLAVGACALMAYGAYMPEQQNMVRAVVIVAFMDVLVAVLSGIAIFSAVFSNGLSPSSGPGLMFVALPVAFSHIPMGTLLLTGFFLLLLFATWTSSINLAEPMVATLSSLGMTRSLASLVVGVGVWAAGLLSALSFSSLAHVYPVAHMTFFDLVTTIPPDIFLPVGGLLITWFAVKVMSAEKARAAFGSSARSLRLYTVWRTTSFYIALPLLCVLLITAVVDVF